MKTYVLYNAQSNNGQGKQAAKRLETVWKDRALTYMEARQLDDYAGFFTKLAPGDTVCVCGGDGTLNYLVNHVDCDRLTHKIYYFPTGSGNDFAAFPTSRSTIHPSQLRDCCSAISPPTPKSKWTESGSRSKKRGWRPP